MSNNLLKVSSLHAGLETGEEILKGIDISINKGETHVIMGPNGAGKSTFVQAIMGHPAYNVTEGEINFCGEDITEASTDARAKSGLFLSFQSPEEIDGISVEDFLKTAKGAVSGTVPRVVAFRKELLKAMDKLDFDESYIKRYLNVGFSGGEKKKSEILQMMILNPKLAILDETDSGLDVDAVKTVSDGIKAFKNDDNALLIISHSTKLLENLDVDYVHILVDGVIVFTGSKDLIEKVNREGFAEFLHSVKG